MKTDTPETHESNRHDKGHRRDASQFFVAGELCRRGLVAVVTMGNCPNTDILCSNADGTKFVHIQVKTFRPGDRSCTVGVKAERNYGRNFYWVLAGIPDPSSSLPAEYYIVPSPVFAKNVRECFQVWLKTPGQKGQQHDQTNKIRAVYLPPRRDLNGWSLKKYRNRWDLIEKCVGVG